MKHLLPFEMVREHETSTWFWPGYTMPIPLWTVI